MQDSAADAQYHLLHMRLLPLLARHLAQDVPLTAQTFLLVSLPPERGLLPLMRMAFLMRQSGLHAMVRGAGISANTAVYTGQSLGIQNIVLMFDHRPPSAILGTQLPLLAQAGFKLYALGSHVMDLVDELRDLNVTLCAGEPSAALASLREHLHTAHE